MKKNVTRVIALALIALMCLALLPMAAFADIPETGAPQVVHESNIVNGQPGRISGLTEDMQYSFDANGPWINAPAGGALEIMQSGNVYFRFKDVEDPTRVSSVIVKDYVTVTALAGTGGSIAPNGIQYVPRNGSVSFTLTPEEGYEVEALTVDGVNVGAQSSYTISSVTAAMTIDASFKQTTPVITSFTVSFDAKGGAPVPKAQTVTAGESVALPSERPLREGFSFLYWTETENGTTPVQFPYTPTQSVTLYSAWEAATVYTLNFNANGGSGEMTSVTHTSNSFTVPACTFTAPEGKHFAGWNSSADGKGDNYAADGTLTIANAEIPSYTLYAKWENDSTDAENVTVSVSYNSFGSVKVGDEVVTSGTPKTVPKGTAFTLVPGENAVTLSVKKDGSMVEKAASFTFDADGSLEVVFEQRLPATEFKTTVTPAGTPTTSGNSKTYHYDISLTRSNGAAVEEHVAPAQPVPFTIPYPETGMTPTSHQYGLIHRHGDVTEAVEITLDASGIHGSSYTFSEYDLIVTEVDPTKLSVTIAPTSVTPGDKLTATVTPSTAEPSYQWFLIDEANSKITAIEGATSGSYTVSKDDVGLKIVCVVRSGANSAQSNTVTPEKSSGGDTPKTKPAAPTSPELKKHIYDGKPGMIIGLDTTMEYQAPGSDKWTPVTGSPMSVADGKEGTYKFRYAETDTTYASDPKSVTVRSYYTVLTAVNRGYGSFTDSTGSGYTTYSDQWVEKGTAYSALIYPARRYYVYSVIDNGKYMGYNRYYSIAKVNGPHTIIINFAGTDSPRTADDSNIPLWAAMCTVSLAGLGAVWMISRRRRKD